jgi:hypothetical protein
LSANVEYEISPRHDAYEGIYLKKDEQILFELRVTYSAIAADGSSKLGGNDALRDPLKTKDIHEWLFEIGKQHLDKVKKFEIVTITSYDVENRKLNKDWELLRREPIPKQFES